MYPMIYFQSFRQLGSGNEVFVAMPMSDPDFGPIWTDIYKDSIESVGLQPYRVNLPKTGDSILIDILRGLRRARLVLVDISPDNKSGEYPNANVMYELGIAHAIRLPETVIVVHRKGARMPFDVTHIRALEYDSNDQKSAKDSIRSYLEGALADGRSLRDDLIDTTWSVMDPTCRDIIAREWYVASGRAEQVAKDKGESFDHPHLGLFEYPVGNWSYMRWEGDQLRPAFSRLLEYGIIEASETPWEIVGNKLPALLYRLTALGEAVARKFTFIKQ